jgi:putative DNA primase/helicase
METFTASHFDRHPAELAMLRGARLVTATETEEGKSWAESKIKALTGGDKISARFMRQDFFEFTPQFKLLIAGNSKPHLKDVNEAMRRRLHLLPFDVTIPADEVDPRLGEKLEAEWPGILAWAIEGCRAWNEVGLGMPDKVRAATDEYLEEEDSIGKWIGECCELGPQDWTSASDLFKSWEAWATARGEWVGKMKTLSQKLKTRLTPARHSKANGFGGIRIIDDDNPPF